MRVGTNPNRNEPAQGLSGIVLAAITHLPEQTSAYHSRRLEVVKTSLQAMRARAHVEHTFIVWDNGSLPELRHWIEDFLRPDIFIQSPNVGKTNARTAICRMLPDDTILSCADDDIFYYDDWLRPQIELLQHFPNVAAVTGYPVRTAFRWGVENTLQWAHDNAKLEAGLFLPLEWEDDFARSIGRDPMFHRQYTANDVDYRVTYNGKRAYCTAHHCQFTGYAGRLAAAAKFENKAMAEERSFDIALDKIGLRLATIQRLTRHIGNVMEPWASEAPRETV